MPEKHAPLDLAVVGAGPAGSVCAYSALGASGGPRVALVDKDTFPRDKACGDAISNRATAFLRELGLGAVFEGRTTVARAQASYPPRYDQLEYLYNHSQDGQKGLEGYIIPREEFDNYLFRAAVARGAQDYTGHKLVDAEFVEPEQCWALTLKQASGETATLRCKTLVGADGPGSRVRRLAGLECSESGHTALALRAYADVKGLAPDVMRFDYLDSLIPGYAWAFPLAPGRFNLGVGLDKRDYKRNDRGMRDYLDEYLAFLRDEGAEISNVAGVMTHPLPMASRPLQLVFEPRLALIGDAAAMVCPFTGEGIHYGIWAGHAVGTAIGGSMNGSGEETQAALEGYAQQWNSEFAPEMRAFREIGVQIRFQKHFM